MRKRQVTYDRKYDKAMERLKKFFNAKSGSEVIEKLLEFSDNFLKK